MIKMIKKFFLFFVLKVYTFMYKLKTLLFILFNYYYTKNFD